MQTQKVGIREFRERLATFLEASGPVAITRHGETVGYYIPARPSKDAAHVAALRTAAVKEIAMTILKWALIFLLISIVAGVLGFTGISAASADVARFLFYVFVVIFLVLLILGLTVFRA